MKNETFTINSCIQELAFLRSTGYDLVDMVIAMKELIVKEHNIKDPQNEVVQLLECVAYEMQKL